MDEIRLGYSDEAAGLVIRWWFGRTFRRMAAASDLWALIDRQTVFALRSRYAILLFQHIASLTGLAHVCAKTFTVAELRAVLGVEQGRHKRFRKCIGRPQGFLRWMRLVMPWSASQSSFSAER